MMGMEGVGKVCVCGEVGVGMAGRWVLVCEGAFGCEEVCVCGEVGVWVWVWGDRCGYEEVCGCMRRWVWMWGGRCGCGGRVYLFSCSLESMTLPWLMGMVISSIQFTTRCTFVMCNVGKNEVEYPLGVMMDLFCRMVGLLWSLQVRRVILK